MKRTTKGQGFVEYALVMVMMAAVVIAVVALLKHAFEPSTTYHGTVDSKETVVTGQSSADLIAKVTVDGQKRVFLVRDTTVYAMLESGLVCDFETHTVQNDIVRIEKATCMTPGGAQ